MSIVSNSIINADAEARYLSPGELDQIKSFVGAGQRRIRVALSHSHDFLIVADEVICGFGRTGNWFGCETFGFKPDLMAMAKGMSSGYLPIGGVMVAGMLAIRLVWMAVFDEAFARIRAPSTVRTATPPGLRRTFGYMRTICSAARRTTSLNGRSSTAAISRKSRNTGSGNKTWIFCMARCFSRPFKTQAPLTLPSTPSFPVSLPTALAAPDSAVKSVVRFSVSAALRAIHDPAGLALSFATRRPAQSPKKSPTIDPLRPCEPLDTSAQPSSPPP